MRRNAAGSEKWEQCVFERGYSEGSLEPWVCLSGGVYCCVDSSWNTNYYQEAVGAKYEVVRAMGTGGSLGLEEVLFTVVEETHLGLCS